MAGNVLISRAFIAPIVAVIVFLVLWEALVWLNDWPNYVMASRRICRLLIPSIGACS